MNIHALAIEEVFRRLRTSEEGLNSAEAASRLQEYGYNEITEARKTSLFVRFFSQFTHFLAILLWVAAGLCFLSELLQPGQGLLSLGVAIVAVIVINAVFSFIQEYRAERAVAALKALLPFDVKVKRDGVEREVPAREVVPGDLILLEEGDKVPADARVVAATRLMVNNAPLTGESDPKPRNAEPFPGDYLDSPNLVFAGTLVVGGKGLAVAVATGMATEFGKIAHLTATVDPGLTPLQREILRVIRIVAAIAVTVGLFFFALGYFIGQSFWHNFLFAIGIIIANVPEGLLPTVTLALAMGSQRLARKKALVKNLNSVETLGSVTVICTDKTGTLTQNRMEVRSLWVPVDGDKTAAELMLLKIAGLCNNAHPTESGYRGDPTEVALLKAARERGVDLAAPRLLELPFDAERKRMSTVNQEAEGGLVLTKGALETVLPVCDKVWTGASGSGPLQEADRQKILAASRALMDQGLRVMAFAYKKLPAANRPLEASELDEETLETALTFVGLAGLEDPPRPEVPEAVRTCHEAGIRVLMLTGDAGRTALAIARQIGLVQNTPKVVEGPELEKMSDQKLREVLSETEPIFARMTPRHKMRIVSILKEEGERVAVTGDGVNDAPALRRADIGVAMGLIGTDVAREAADMVLLDDNFATIVRAVEEGRTIFENIRKFMVYIFAHLTPEAVPYILFSFLPIPLPLTVMQILAIDLGTETIPALALGVEKPEAGIMKPQPVKKTLITPGVLFRSYVFLGLISTVGVLFGYFYVLFSGGWQWGELLPTDATLARQAATATFLGIVIMQVGIVFACRSSTESIFHIGFLTNRMVLVGIVFELLLTAWIIYHPWGQAIFGTAPLPARVWLLFMPFALALLILEEGRKLLVRKWARSHV